MTDELSERSGKAPHLLPPELIHDLRTPLNHIIGYSEMVMEQVQDAGHDELLPYLEKVRAAGYKMLALIDSSFVAIRGTPLPAIEPISLDPEPLKPDRRKLERATGRAGPGAGWGSLLVVDDNEGNREELSHRLTRQGYSVSTAEGGRQALEMLNAGAFELVLLDVAMPEMDGFEVLQRLKSDDRLRQIPVIVISALTDMDSVTRCLELGAEDYLPKPFNATLLRARIGACLEQKRARDLEILLFDQLQQKQARLQELEYTLGDGPE